MVTFNQWEEKQHKRQLNYRPDYTIMRNLYTRNIHGIKLKIEQKQTETPTMEVAPSARKTTLTYLDHYIYSPPIYLKIQNQTGNLSTLEPCSFGLVASIPASRYHQSRHQLTIDFWKSPQTPTTIFTYRTGLTTAS
jgi:hypothetical protein